jgi:flagellar FliL protein
VTGARAALKESLQEKIIEAYTVEGEPLVLAIYYTEYVTQ